jgi:hypothetical protein
LTAKPEYLKKAAERLLFLYPSFIAPASLPLLQLLQQPHSLAEFVYNKGHSGYPPFILF